MTSHSTPIYELDCPTRMFLVTVCLSDQDLVRLGWDHEQPSPFPISPAVAARAGLHRLCLRDQGLARRVCDLLDLRHLDTITFVRNSDPEDLERTAFQHGSQSEGSVLAAWAWALLTDAREDVKQLGRRMMAECYVRSMQQLVETPVATTTTLN